MEFLEIIRTLPTHLRFKLRDLKEMRERPDFHPEPSVFHHINIVTDRAIQLGDPDIICAAILHDIHKKDTMMINEKTGHPTSPGHDKFAHRTILRDLDVREWVEEFGADPEIVAGICGDHMRVHVFSQMRKSKQMKMMDEPHFNKLLIFACLDDMLITDEVSISDAKDTLSRLENRESDGEENFHEWLMSFGKHHKESRKSPK